MYEPNICVNNSKFISIVDNVIVLQLPPHPPCPFDGHENLLRIIMYNIIIVNLIINLILLNYACQFNLFDITILVLLESCFKN